VDSVFRFNHIWGQSANHFGLQAVLIHFLFKQNQTENVPRIEQTPSDLVYFPKLQVDYEYMYMFEGY
jgi:hypothetical protein